MMPPMEDGTYVLLVEAFGNEVGTIVWPFRRHTYGAISRCGWAVTADPNGDYPFFEVHPNEIARWEDM